MPYTDGKALNIFLSYSHEDQAIADAIANKLREAFYQTIEITMMSEFSSGVSWQELIWKAIDKTDILIAIATGRLKEGFSFTGTEIGGFQLSVRHNRFMTIAPTIERRLIPFAVLDRVPAALDEYEGIKIDTSSVYDVRFDSSNLLQDIQGLSQNATDAATAMVYKFIGNLQNIVYAAAGQPPQVTDVESRIKFLHGIAYQLTHLLLSNISNRKRDERNPKSKLVIRTNPRPKDPENILADATVETFGPCQDSLGISTDTQSLNWSSLLELASGPDVAYEWNRTFGSVVRDTAVNNIVENNTIISYDGKQLFRLFVAKLTILYSGELEFTIYIIPLLRPKDYGDPKTTALLKALQVSLGYRSMFLEEESDFSPAMITAGKIENLQATVSKMRRSLNLLLQVSKEAGLDEPGTIVMILGLQSVDELPQLYHLWDTEKLALYERAKEVLSERPTREKTKMRFVNQLRSFCERTRELNKRYSSRVMDVLQTKMSQ